jgi:hypothetical protein
MLRVLAVLPALAVTACVTNDGPSLQLAVASDGTLQIELARAPGHLFTSLSATANGIDCGAPMLGDGTARFSIAMAQLGTDVEIAVVEGGERFVAGALGLGRARTLVVSMDTPLYAGEWIGLGDAFAADRLDGSFAVTSGGQTCTVPWATRYDPAMIELQVPSDLLHDWWCAPAPSPGATASARIEIHLAPAAIATTCSGGVSCPPIRLPELTAASDVAVQF